MRPSRLKNVTVVVTRGAAQGEGLVARLEGLGARVVAVPVIAIAEPGDGGAALDAAVDRLLDFERIALASPNAARALNQAIHRVGAPGPLPPVACVGQATAAVVDPDWFSIDLVAPRAIAESLVEAIGTPTADPARILVVAAAVSRPTLFDGLAANGWSVERVTGYRTVDADIDPAQAQAAARADVITFTSPSTVERYMRLVGPESVPPMVACIGPVTAAAAAELGLSVEVVADPHTLDGLVAGIVAWRAGATPPDLTKGS